jgi:hypothetical protein
MALADIPARPRKIAEIRDAAATGPQARRLPPAPLGVPGPRRRLLAALRTLRREGDGHPRVGPRAGAGALAIDDPNYAATAVAMAGQAARWLGS